MEYILGIDQGATKTIAVISDVKGNIMAVGHADGGYHAVTGEEHAMGEINKAINQACDIAGITNNKWAVVGAGLTGADFDYEYPLLRKALKKIVKSDHIIVINDCIVAFHAGTMNNHGAIVCAGTGLNCGIKAPDGREFIYGYAIQDQWQGGSGIGMKALWTVIEAHIGLKPPTMLTEIILDYYEVASPSILLEKYVRKELKDHVKNLVPLVDECAIKGDQCAIEIMSEFATMCAKYVIAGFKRFDMLNIESELVLSGGIFKCKNEILYHVIEKYIHHEAPLISVIDAKYEPVIGGVITGIERLYGKIGKEIQDNINETAKKHGLMRSRK